MTRVVLALAVVGILAGELKAADKTLAWPRFRGPNGSGVADLQKPPVELGPKKNVRWKVACPNGLSSPIVAGDNLVLTAFDKGKLYTIAYNRTDGKEVWRREAKAKKIEPFFPVGGGPASSTSVTDGKRIVSYFGSCGLVCYNLMGKELWTYKLLMPRIAGNFGSGVSPIIVDGTVILVRDELKTPTILAVDLATGKKKWEKQRRSKASFCTPIAWKTPTGTQVVSAGHGRMVGYDPANGDEKWTLNGMPSSCCPSPITANGTLYFAGWSPGGADDKTFKLPKYDVILKAADTNKDGVLSRDEAQKSFVKQFFDNADANLDRKLTRTEWDSMTKSMAEGVNVALAVKPGGKGVLTKSHIRWKRTRGLPYLATAIVYRGQMVMIKDGGIVTAVDSKTGTSIYMKRPAASGKYYASPVAANGHIYCISYEEGVVTVLKAGAKTPTVVAKNPKLGEKVSATPAIADDTLYIRTEKHLYAFGKK